MQISAFYKNRCASTIVKNEQMGLDPSQIICHSVEISITKIMRGGKASKLLKNGIRIV